MSATKKSSRLLSTSLLGVLFVGSCGGIMVLITPKVEEQGKRERVTEAVPLQYPVLFFAPQDDAKPRVIRYEQFESEKKRHPEYSLLVPEGKEQQVNAWLRESAEFGGRKEVAVEASSEGKQSLKLHVDSNEYTTISWYNATEKEIFPQYYEAHRGPAGVRTLMKYAGWAFLTTLAGFALGGWLWRLRFRAAT
jgi:hypothetical protein